MSARMRRRSEGASRGSVVVVVVLLVGLMVACASTAPSPKTKPAAGSAAASPAAGAGTAKRPSALRRRPGLVALLQRLGVDGQRLRRAGGVFVGAFEGFGRALRYLGALRRAVAATAAGARVVADIDRQMRMGLGLQQVTPKALQQLASRWGIATDRPAGFVVGTREPTVVLSLRDAKVFRDAVVKRGPFRRLNSFWREDGDLWRLMLRPLPHREVQMAACVFGRRFATCAAGQQSAPSRSAPAGSLWSKLDAAQRARIAGGNPPHAVVWVSHQSGGGTAMLRLDDGGISADADATGIAVRAVLASLPQTSAGQLYGVYRAMKGERLYLRVPRAAVARAMRGQLRIGLSGEVLVGSAGACTLPALLLGSADAKATTRAVGRLAKLLRKTVRRGKLRLSKRKLAGRAAVQISGLRRLSPGLPDAVGVTTTPAGLLVAPWACIGAAAKLAQTKPAAGKGAAPIIAGRFGLGDPLRLIWPMLKKVTGAKLPPKLLRAIATARFLAAQLHGTRFSVAAPGGDRLRVKVAIDTLHRGPADDAARALWHRAVAARVSGRSAEHARLVAQIARAHAKTRYAAAAKRKPVLLSALGGVMAAVAIPAFVKYLRKSKTVEATEGLDKIKVGAKSYFQADHYDKQGNLLPKQFPKGKTGWTPKTPCCKQPGRKCRPDPKAWNTPVWRSLQFQLTDPHYFQWRWRTKGTNKKATFVVEARADLDCDGKYSSYKLLGSVDNEFGVVSRGPIISNELE